MIHPLLRIGIGVTGVILFLIFTPILDLCEVALQVVLLPLLFCICILGVGDGVYALARDMIHNDIFGSLRARLTAYQQGMRKESHQAA